MKFLLPLLLLLGCAAREPVLVLDSSEPLVREAAEVWNDAAGFEAVVLAPGGIKVLPLPANWDTEAVGCYTPGSPEIRIRYPQPLRVYVHEIGHALGLEHEEESGSVMRPAPPIYWKISERSVWKISSGS